MEKNNELEINKFNSLYKDVFIEISNELKLKEHTERFKKKQIGYLEKLDLFFHNKCPHEFEWIEKNSSIINGEMKYNEGTDKNEFEIKNKELNECIKKHDTGLTTPVVNFEKEFEMFNNEVSKGISECFKMENETERKLCVKDKIMNNTKQLLEIFNKYEKTFEEMNHNIKL